MTDPLRPCQWSEAVTFGVRMAPDGEPGRWVARRRFFKRGAGTPYRKLQSIKFLLTRDRRAVLDFLAARYPFDFPLRRRLQMLQRFTHVTNHVRGYHTLAEIRASMEELGVARFKLPERLVIVDEIAVTNVGKVDKKALRADVAARIEEEGA